VAVDSLKEVPETRYKIGQEFEYKDLVLRLVLVKDNEASMLVVKDKYNIFLNKIWNIDATIPYNNKHGATKLDIERYVRPYGDIIRVL